MVLIFFFNPYVMYIVSLDLIKSINHWCRAFGDSGLSFLVTPFPIAQLTGRSVAKSLDLKKIKNGPSWRWRSRCLPQTCVLKISAGGPDGQYPGARTPSAPAEIHQTKQGILLFFHFGMQRQM